MKYISRSLTYDLYIRLKLIIYDKEKQEVINTCVAKRVKHKYMSKNENKQAYVLISLSH